MAVSRSCGASLVLVVHRKSLCFSESRERLVSLPSLVPVLHLSPKLLSLPLLLSAPLRGPTPGKGCPYTLFWLGLQRCRNVNVQWRLVSQTRMLGASFQTCMSSPMCYLTALVTSRLHACVRDATKSQSGLSIPSRRKFPLVCAYCSLLCSPLSVMLAVSALLNECPALSKA